MGQAELVVGETGLLHHPVRATVRIGRSPQASLRLRDPMVSKDHAAITCDDTGGYVLEHRRGRNGTFLNGEPITGSAPLRDGDVIVVGQTRLRFCVAESEYVDPVHVGLVEDVHPPHVSCGAHDEDALLDWDSTSEADREQNYRRLHAAYTLSRALAVDRDIRLLYQRLADAAFHFLEPDRVVVFSLDDDGSATPVFARIRNWNGKPVRVSSTILREALRTAGGVMAVNAVTDKRFAVADSVTLQGIRSSVCVPMVSEGRCVGAVYVDCRRALTKLDERDRALLSTFATQTAAAVQRCEHHRETLARQRQKNHRERLAMLGRLTAGVAHELKNPVTYLLNNFDYIASQIEGCVDPDVMASIEDAKLACERIHVIASDLNVFSRQDPPHTRQVDLAPVVELAVGMTAAETRSVAQVVTDIAPDLRSVRATKARLAQVLVNLIVNAAHAMHDTSPDNRICIRAERAKPGWIRLEVTDNGHGIPPKQLDRVFEPFYTTKADGRGTGLGLSICRDIVTAFGGGIRARSQEGEGTTFEIILPEVSVSRDSTTQTTQVHSTFSLREEDRRP